MSRTATEHVLRQAVSLGTFYGIQVFCWVAPEATDYPFLVVTPVSGGSSDYTLGKTTGVNARIGTEIHYPLVQVTGYAASSGACWELGQLISRIMENMQDYDVADEYAVRGSWKTSERGPMPYTEDGAHEDAWQISQDYRLTVVSSNVPIGQGGSPLPVSTFTFEALDNNGLTIQVNVENGLIIGATEFRAMNPDGSTSTIKVKQGQIQKG